MGGIDNTPPRGAKHPSLRLPSRERSETEAYLCSSSSRPSEHRTPAAARTVPCRSVPRTLFRESRFPCVLDYAVNEPVSVHRQNCGRAKDLLIVYRITHPGHKISSVTAALTCGDTWLCALRVIGSSSPHGLALSRSYECPIPLRRDKQKLLSVMILTVP